VNARRFVVGIGVAVASGALLAACAGTPQGLAHPTASFGFGPVLALPALHAPAAAPPVLVNQNAPAPAPVPAASPPTTASQTSVTSQQTVHAFGGGCEQ
jgi:hypothetical protein